MLGTRSYEMLKLLHLAKHNSLTFNPMARQTGIIKVKGTIGGINFYESRGKELAREAGGGFNSESNKKHEVIAHWNSEMGAASTANAAFRKVFRNFIHGYKDGTLPQRLQSLFMSIKDLDTTSERGKRRVGNGIEHPYAKRLLKDFDFTPKRPYLLNAQLHFDWASNTLTVTNFDIRGADIPRTADFMGLQLMSVLFDFHTLEHVSAQSDFLELPPDFVSTNFIMTVPALPDGPGTRLVFLRVGYYQQVSGVNYLLPGDGKFGLGIVGLAS